MSNRARSRIDDGSGAVRNCTLLATAPALQALPPSTGRIDPRGSLRGPGESVSSWRYVKLWIDAKIGPSISLAMNRCRRYDRLNRRQARHSHPSSIGRGSRRWPALRSLTVARSRSGRWRSGRSVVGRTQSNRSTPTSRSRRGCPEAGPRPSGTWADPPARQGVVTSNASRTWSRPSPTLTPPDRHSRRSRARARLRHTPGGGRHGPPPGRSRTVPGPVASMGRLAPTRPSGRSGRRPRRSPPCSPAGPGRRRGTWRRRRRGSPGSPWPARGSGRASRPSRCDRNDGAGLGELGPGGEAEDLEASGVGQDRPVPVHEGVEARPSPSPPRRRDGGPGDRCWPGSSGSRCLGAGRARSP